MIQALPAAPETGAAGGGALVGAMIAQTVVGAGQTTLNFLDAFCVTKRCRENQAQRRTDLEIAQLQKEGLELQAGAAIAAAKAGARTQQTIIALGFGVLALGAWYLAGRSK